MKLMGKVRSATINASIARCAAAQRRWMTMILSEVSRAAAAHHAGTHDSFRSIRLVD
jgi:hypothetical protein